MNTTLSQFSKCLPIRYLIPGERFHKYYIIVIGLYFVEVGCMLTPCFLFCKTINQMMLKSGYEFFVYLSFFLYFDKIQNGQLEIQFGIHVAL